LRWGQQAVIDTVLAGTHTLAIMPTEDRAREGAIDMVDFRMAPRDVLLAPFSAHWVRWA
jgi:hypothetical protein